MRDTTAPAWSVLWATTTMLSRLSITPFLSLLGALSGCYSTTLLQEPEPLALGAVRAAVGFSVAADDTASRRTLHPTPELGARVGLGHDLELRGKLYATGIEAGINSRVYDGEDVDLMLMPSYSAALNIMENGATLTEEDTTATHKIRAFALPAILRVELGEGVDVFAGPDVRAGKRDGKAWVATGAHLGAAFDIGARASLIPECALLWVVEGSDPVAGNPEKEDVGSHILANRDVSARCGLGVTLGGKHAAN